ncbi:MAG: FAD binding domain-containing protein [Chloroflexi bacterium]|nr:FAD binding domain-containing protein [Chloroflexota bacterium]
MITTYHRPQTLDEALNLLTQPNTVPLGGGTLLSQPTVDSVQAVDLQALGLDFLTKKGNDLEIGATATLQSLLENEACPAALKAAIKLEAPINIRNSATVAGTLVASDGRSPFATALLAMDAKLTIDHGPKTVDGQSSIVYGLGDFLPLRPHGLITAVTVPLNTKLAFEFVSRTPADKPIVCAALAQWNSGRTRLALGGYGKSPMLAMDGTEADGIESAARNAFHEATDEWASAAYRMDVASTLAKRCLGTI